MKILLAEDGVVSAKVIRAVIEEGGYEVIIARDGLEAWETWREQGNRIVIADWLMPKMSGPELCRKIRAAERRGYTYFILLTAREKKEELVHGLEAGADDYITKPFDRDELKMRVRAGERIIRLEDKLSDQIRKLEAALSRVRLLEGLLPICCTCKKIRDDKGVPHGAGAWENLEKFIGGHSEASFSHTFCPECYEKYKKEYGLDT